MATEYAITYLVSFLMLVIYIFSLIFINVIGDLSILLIFFKEQLLILLIFSVSVFQIYRFLFYFCYSRPTLALGLFLFWFTEVGTLTIYCF